MAELSEAADKAGAATRLAEAAASDVVEVARNHMVWMWGGFGAGVTVGALGGFFGAKLRLEKKYEKLAEEEIAEMRRHYRKRADLRLHQKPDLADLNKLVKDQQYKEPGAPVSPTPDGPSVVPGVPASPPVSQAEVFHRVFSSETAPVGSWDYEAEKALRESLNIYVIHRDEFGETGNAETTLSYYAGDDVLCDANDHIIDDQTKLVDDCLVRFGHGSHDRNVVYVRNETLDLDMEVVKSEKTYAEEVHGLKHSDTRRGVPRRRR